MGIGTWESTQFLEHHQLDAQNPDNQEKYYAFLCPILS